LSSKFSFLHPLPFYVIKPAFLFPFLVHPSPLTLPLIFSTEQQATKADTSGTAKALVRALNTLTAGTEDDDALEVREKDWVGLLRKIILRVTLRVGAVVSGWVDGWVSGRG